MTARCLENAFLACLATGGVSVGVAVPTLAVVIGHKAGNPREVAVTPVSSQSSMKSFGLMSPFHSNFDEGLTNMTCKAS